MGFYCCACARTWSRSATCWIAVSESATAVRVRRSALASLRSPVAFRALRGCFETARRPRARASMRADKSAAATAACNTVNPTSSGNAVMAEVKSDIEIARAAKKKPIQEIGAKLGIPTEHLLPYGHDKAKISAEFIKSKQRRQGRQADPRHRHQPDAGRRRQDHDHGRPRRRPEPHRQEGDRLHPRGLARARISASRAVRPAAAMRRSCRWRT